MTVYIPKRERCRLCFSLILRDRSTLFSSICCQKYYHLFKHVQRTKIPLKRYHPYKMKVSNRTVCFGDLIRRYLHATIEPMKNFSNFICYDCSRMLLDIEQCAKYLRKKVNQVKTKYNKSNRLVTSSLSATVQKKRQTGKPVHVEQLPLSNSDDDDQFDDIDDEEEASNDDDDDDPPSALPANAATSVRSKTPRFNSLATTIRNTAQTNTTSRHKTNSERHDPREDDGDDEEDDEEEEDGAVLKSASNTHETNAKNFQESLRRQGMSTGNVFDPSITSLDATNPNILQLRLMQMLANATAGQPIGHDGNNVDSMMHTLANMQRDFMMKLLHDPMAAAQVAQFAAVAAAAASAPSNNTSGTPLASVTSNHKQSGSGRKRKSHPEKRVITRHRSTDDNGETGSPSKHESSNNSTENMNHEDMLEHPLELTRKNNQRSTRDSPSADDQNSVINSIKKENGNSSNAGQVYQHLDEDYNESAIPNDFSLTLSPSESRRSGVPKRQRLSTSGHLDHGNASSSLPLGGLPQTTADLLTPNHHFSNVNDDNNSNPRQRKLDPRSCAECGKVLFSDKTLLFHCQTHAKNEKQCWICGASDDDIKKHILTEHGSQKFTNTGFKCQHCDQVFPVFADLETHTKEHSKKKPFECPICHKRFGQQGNLSCHLRIHSGVKPFTCTSCGKAFRHSNSLRRHARTVHSASRGLTTTSNSLLLSHSAASLANDYQHDAFDDAPSGLMIPSDDGSSSAGDVPSPSMSNTQVDSD